MSTVIERAHDPYAATREPDPPPRTLSVRARGVATSPIGLLVGLTAAGATILFWLVHDSLIDDAYITLTYARTLADHGDWGMLPGHEANSATSPLNVLLLGGLNSVVGDPVLALGVLYVLTCVGLAVGLVCLGTALRLGHRVAVLGTPLLVANPLLASTIGLETMLVVTAMTYLVWACVRGDATTAGIVSGVLLWLRLDTAVVVVILVLATPALWRGLVRIAALAAAVVGPWLVFSWLVLGSAIPDTLIIKRGEPWGDFATGLVTRYSVPYGTAITDLFVVGGTGVVAVLSWVWWRRRGIGDSTVVPALAAAGAAYFGLMWMLQVPPFFWYYAPTLAALTLAAVIGLATLSTPRFGPATRAFAVTTASGLVVLTLVPWWSGASAQTPLREMPIHGNWALPGEYAQIGRELHDIVGDTPVHSPGEVGALAYFCDCTIVDRFSDRGMVSNAIQDARDGTWLSELNYLRLEDDQLDRIVPGYWLVWRPGPDPTGRGWNTIGITGGHRENGHLALLTHPPRKADHPRSGPQRPRSDQERSDSLR